MNKEEQIKHIANVLWHYPNPCEFNNYNLVEELVREAFDNTQSAEKKTGKWSFIGNNLFECTYCGVAYTPDQLKSVTIYKDQFAPYYCPICGADMRGDTE